VIRDDQHHRRRARPGQDGSGYRLDPDGNDYPVKTLGIRCLETDGPEQTAGIIEDVIADITAGTRI